MTQEDKELLLKDLCARLPYDVMVNVEGYDTEKLIGIENETITTKATPTSYSDKGEYPIYIVKPYLRQMSSMTEEEKKQYGELCDEDIRQLTSVPILHPGLKYKTSCHRSIIWLLENHFDFMGLIPKDLAIEVTEDNNPYKE